MTSRVWDRDPRRAPCWAWSLLKIHSLPLPPCPAKGRKLCLETLSHFRDFPRKFALKTLTKKQIIFQSHKSELYSWNESWVKTGQTWIKTSNPNLKVQKHIIYGDYAWHLNLPKASVRFLAGACTTLRVWVQVPRAVRGPRLSEQEELLCVMDHRV